MTRYTAIPRKNEYRETNIGYHIYEAIKDRNDTCDKLVELFQDPIYRGPMGCKGSRVWVKDSH